MASWNKEQPFELNSSVQWNFDTDLPADEPIWILAEEDTCNPTQIPSIFRVMYDLDAPTGCRVKLLDYDPERHSEILDPNNWSIIAWRPLTNHGETWDEFFFEQGITEASNWTLHLDKIEEDEDDIAGIFFSVSLDLGSAANVELANALFSKIESIRWPSDKPLNFLVKSDSDNSTVLTIYNEGGETDIEALGKYILQVGLLAKLKGIFGFTYAVLGLPDFAEYDGGGCMVINFDKMKASVTDTQRVMTFYSNKRFPWFSWRKLFSSIIS